MQYPWTVGQQFVDLDAYETALRSAGMFASLQVGIAEILDEHTLFKNGRVPIVVDCLGDFNAEMQRLLSSGKIAILVKTPAAVWEQVNVWNVTVVIQVIEVPIVNRVSPGYVTALRGAEICLAMLKDRSPKSGFGPFRPRRIETVQATPDVGNVALTGNMKTMIVAVEG